MQIEKVITRNQLNEFIVYPYSFYRNDPLWIPPLRSEQKKLFNPQKDTLLQHCDYQLFLARDSGQIVGRAAAFIDHHYKDKK